MAYPAPVYLSGTSTPENYARQIDGHLVEVFRTASELEAAARGGSIKRDVVLRLVRVCGLARKVMDEIRDDVSGDYNSILIALAEMWKTSRDSEKTLTEVNDALKAAYAAVGDFRDFGIANYPKGTGDFLLVYKFDVNAETIPGTISPVPGAFTNALDTLLAAFE